MSIEKLKITQAICDFSFWWVPPILVVFAASGRNLVVGGRRFLDLESVAGEKLSAARKTLGPKIFESGPKFQFCYSGRFAADFSIGWFRVFVCH